MDIKTIKTKEDLKNLFDFFVDVFKLDAEEYNEKFYDMTERYKTMEKQFDADNEFIMYIKDNDKIIAGITGSNMNNDKITLSILGVDKKYRNNGLAKKLILEFEKRCKEKGVCNIDLGARKRAVKLYSDLGYSYSLLVQVTNDKIDEIRFNNKYNLKEKRSYKSNSYSYVIYDVNDIDNKYIDNFINKIDGCFAQYMFEKRL